MGTRTSLKLVPLRTTQFKETVLHHCNKRGDSWARAVKGKIEYIQDCIAADCVYHNACHTSFRTGRQVPRVFPESPAPVKKQYHCYQPQFVDNVRHLAFLKAAEHLQTVEEGHVTLREVTQIMASHLKGTEFQPYSAKHMRRKTNCVLW